MFWLNQTLNRGSQNKREEMTGKISNITLNKQTGISTMYMPNLNLTIYTYQSLSQNNVWTPLHIFSEHFCKCSRTEYCALLHCKPCKPRNGCVWKKNVNWSGIVHISELAWKDCLICSWFVEIGRFPFNGLTSQTRILFPLSIMEYLVYISQKSRENGHHSNVI
jgi:hypothetical protein